ncbi:MAG TPA: hypothetical protein VN940_04890 [Candidatus Dormibacteraeota bacterium]|nr:hypothetical protein [Candidatus Dormibacteraeota bacterium]
MTDPTLGVVTYRLVGYRPLIFILFPALGLVGVALVLNLLSGGEGPGPWFVFFWLAAYAWNAYWFLFRLAYEVGVTDTSTLRWCTVTRCREIPVSSLKEIETPVRPFGVGLKRIVVEGDRSPLIMASPGIRDVIAMVLKLRPDLAVRDRWYDLLFERLSHRSVQWRKV